MHNLVPEDKRAHKVHQTMYNKIEFITKTI